MHLSMPPNNNFKLGLGHFFINLFWDDILFVKLLPLLSIRELFVLRGLSRKYKLLIDSYFGKLKRLNLGQHNARFTTEAFKVLSENCCQLREVMLPRSPWLSDDVIIPLFENNCHLTKIVLNKCSRLTSVCLQPVIIDCKDLKSLCLAECTWLTVGCLQSITLHQRSLEEVDFSCCFFIDELETINNFLVISHRLKKLNLSRLSCVNDTTLTVISRSARQLELLNISGCSQATFYGVNLVLEYCRKLKLIMCGDCPAIQRDGGRLRNPEILRPRPLNLRPVVVPLRMNV